MTVLEREGYLVQPHTSAGRIPTDLGYRYFVDHFIKQRALPAPERRAVSEFFASAHRALEDLLHETSQMLARVTDHAAVVVGPPHDVAQVRTRPAGPAPPGRGARHRGPVERRGPEAHAAHPVGARRGDGRRRRPPPSTVTWVVARCPTPATASRPTTRWSTRSSRPRAPGSSRRRRRAAPRRSTSAARAGSRPSRRSRRPIARPGCSSCSSTRSSSSRSSATCSTRA